MPLDRFPIRRFTRVDCSLSHRDHSNLNKLASLLVCDVSDEVKKSFTASKSDEVTLADFKAGIPVHFHKFKFFFKSKDDDFGVVKEEIIEDQVSGINRMCRFPDSAESNFYSIFISKLKKERVLLVI
jgi:hypothetical protein